MSDAISLAQPTPYNRLLKRFQAAVLAINDLCPNERHRELMRRTIFDQCDLLESRLVSRQDHTRSED